MKIKSIIAGVIMTTGIATTGANAETVNFTTTVQSISGVETVATGYIGRGAFDKDNTYIIVNGVKYSALLDAGRSARKSISDCEIGFMNDGNCTADMAIEVNIDGNEVKAIVYEINNLVVSD